MRIIVTVVVKEENRLLMVKEGQEKCYGQWNFPAGHLDPNENIFTGAIREAKEETGYDVELISLLSIQNYARPDDTLLRIIFNAKIVSGEMKADGEEILEVKWIPIEELESMEEKNIRGVGTIMDIVQDAKQEKSYPLEVIKNLL